MCENNVNRQDWPEIKDTQTVFEECPRPFGSGERALKKLQEHGFHYGIDSETFKETIEMDLSAVEDRIAELWKNHSGVSTGRFYSHEYVSQLKQQNAVLERLLNEALEWLPWDTGDLLRARIRAQLRLPIPAIAQPDEGAE